MKYSVVVQRECIQELTISVEASNEAEAEAKALQRAPDCDFGGTEKDARYTVELITEEEGSDG